MVQQELVTVSRDGRQVVRISRESSPLSEAEKWEQSVAGLPAGEQVRAVAARPRERNPGFDGKITPTVRDGEVTELRLLTDHVDDLSPLCALRRLRKLWCNGRDTSKGRLSDLGPLCGLPLDHLDCSHTRVSDLEPLRGMPLALLSCGYTPVADLSPLKGADLHTLIAQAKRVSDLTPLTGMPLKWLDLHRAGGVTDLRPLRGAPLEYLNLTGLRISDLAVVGEQKPLTWLVLDETPITDLTPLRGMRITNLNIKGTPVADLDPIKGLPLTKLRFDYRPDRKEFVRSFADLAVINDTPTAEFWEDVGGK